ncbi:tRNA pseudouridine(55) synthase TruB [Parasphingorhabdus cellanae]|uniref:tRNA pseudouridine synthase B n=1 Tax=Parasphingorhabdus cellanae TaxID=2806553 RepID=A0ABX7T4Y8_9SPHN|nr:tRNA pseudouridine(55) synthase TruB [Parasphingorhabdus cellanae]QTD56661.1 tRNA pseudouridine(55) synthase TruB [Parasphingorhabdus cellanae]
MKPHGWIILDKPLELGSTQAVGAVKRNLREAGLLGKGKDKTKVGHGGTLDPLATGVLPIALGEATKLCGRMLDASKVYEFTVAFGSETETLDAEGEVTEASDHLPTLAEVEAILPQFTGPIDQIPPQYSALKIDGKRAYDLARAGEAVEMKMRSVTIYALSVSSPLEGEDGDACERSELAKLGEGLRESAQPDPSPTRLGQQAAKSPFPLPQGERIDSVTLIANVSKGTYIRSLARDIARALGTVGHVTMLRRTKAGPFTLKHAISLDKLNEIGKGADIKDYLLPLEAGLDDIPAVDLTPDQARLLRQGQVLDEQELIGNPPNDGLFLATEDGSPVALAELVVGTVKVVRGFNM